MRRYLAFVLLLAFLGGCSTYRPQSWISGGEGYQEEELAPRVYRVEFKGSERDFRRYQVEDYALLRAAELTLEKEYRYFVIVVGETHVSGGDFWISSERHLGFEPGDTPGIVTNRRLEAIADCCPTTPTRGRGQRCHQTPGG